ncbi:hypothetical protein BGZ61DRAFT_455431 [Ilyonectria robusta]|uniref:uncharacterized protein n=1 Tax=Ilyonectria robusta TaxID=1079257 RepID=UPI001E8D4D38|nr:uncharacterized protein BGZ61DRAFT_455431 [Ilyonectria robusta]KAH8683922.1 hypothetical protein BGZ61DRAFT_455431 [Ilyonectria robusta]
MAESESVEPISTQLELVLKFCPEKTLEELQSGFSTITDETVAFLDDRTNGMQKAFHREYLGPLTAYQLWLAIKRKRFEFNEHGCTETNDQTRPAKSQSVLSRADRRSIFIPDLNRWAMMAIISTATINQSRALRDTFYRHLAFESFISASFSPNGLWNSSPTFQLAFDLPFYVLRRASPHNPPQDRRPRGDNDTLRKVTDLTFLQRPTGSETLILTDYLCEAQVSVLITGSDPQRWMAYCFIDTYFDPEERRESVDSYLDDLIIDEDSHSSYDPDPFTTGENDANYPMSTPREYFLVVLDSRLRHVKDEWCVLTRGMSEMIKTCINTCPIAIFNPQSSNLDIRLAFVQSCAWAVKARKLLSQLIKTLKATIKQLETFQADRKFSTITGPAAGCVRTILANTEQLGIDLQNLECLSQDCQDYIATITLYVDVETSSQVIKARYRQAVNFILLFIFTPIVLAASVLYRVYKNMPLPLTYDSALLLSLVMIFMVSIWLSVGIMRNWERIKSVSGIRVFKREVRG